MATKLLQSLTDDNPDLQRQIGCMTGIFQLFDRQHIVTPRRITGHNAKRPPSGSVLDKESSNIYSRSVAAEKQSAKNGQERQRLSTESSRASFSSSSRSSSFSSLDCNMKPAQAETLSFDRMIFPDTPSRDPVVSQPNSSPQLGRQSLDLRDVVKDSMLYREAHGLPVRTAYRDEVADPLAKHGDSPRPMQFSRPNDDVNDSLRVLAKLREAPCYNVGEPRELSRSTSYQSKDGSFYSSSKEPPRFSYDGREASNASFASRDTSKPSMKFRELPRLSLDSRESSMRSYNSDSKSDIFVRLPQKENGNGGLRAQVRPPSVVAKLMGLEAIPDSLSTSSSSSEVKMDSRDIIIEESNHFDINLDPSTLYRSMQRSNSSKNLWKEPKSPRWKSPEPVMKPISRFPLEPAPWKHLDGANRNSQKPISRGMMRAPVKAANNLPSVYSEIERRLKDLEFSQSGKDLRALKQILEAMQAKGLLETHTEEDSSFSDTKEHEQKFGNEQTKARSQGNQRKQPGDMISSSNSTRRVGSTSTRNFESPIVIMKPAKLVEKSGIPVSSVISIDGFSSLPRIQGGNFVDSRKNAASSRASKDHQIPKSSGRDNNVSRKDAKINSRVAKPPTSTRSSQLPKEKDSSPGLNKISGSISPRMQQKRLELERRSKPPVPSSDSVSRTRRHTNKQANDSSSPGGKRRPKSSSFQQSDEQMSEVSNESRNLMNISENETSAQSEGSVVSDSRMDVEVTSYERAQEMSSIQDSPLKNAHNLMDKISTLMSREEELLPDHQIVSPEYPSPVSVLDCAVDRDNLPSPVKCTTKTIRGDEFEEHDDASIGSCPNSSEMSRKKLQNVENLVQKLRRLNSSHDEARTDYIASLCENTNPDHRYISEILLASGLLLRDLGSSPENFQFHPSGHPINPELFLVLEQTKGRNFLKEECGPREKTHRKLIFDSINEILTRKLAILGPFSEPYLRPGKLAKKTLNAQKLLRELCSEMELMQERKSECISSEEEGNAEMKMILLEDVMHRSENWTSFHNETSSMVLDVERLIFKDLVNEVVIGEALSTGVKTTATSSKPARPRRQLFAK